MKQVVLQVLHVKNDELINPPFIGYMIGPWRIAAWRVVMDNSEAMPDLSVPPVRRDNGVPWWGWWPWGELAEIRFSLGTFFFCACPQWLVFYHVLRYFFQTTCTSKDCCMTTGTTMFRMTIMRWWPFLSQLRQQAGQSQCHLQQPCVAQCHLSFPMCSRHGNFMSISSRIAA